MSDQYHMQLCAVASVPCGHEKQWVKLVLCTKYVEISTGY